MYVIDLDDAAPRDRYQIAASNVRGLVQWSLWTQEVAEDSESAESVVDLITTPGVESGDKSLTSGTEEGASYRR
jgi:hypothetical protein